jgi:hypothetical protein
VAAGASLFNPWIEAPMPARPWFNVAREAAIWATASGSNAGAGAEVAGIST